MDGGKALEDYAALIRLKVGEVSNSFQTTDYMGNQMSKIVKLVEIIPPHTASLKDDYVRLEEMALNQKSERYFTEWLNKKIESMYIYIAPEFRTWKFENKKWIK
jgi:peptidyl-prolyl cis-trans isomerase SurA